MVKLNNIIQSLLLEQEDKISVLRDAIINRKPLTINYVGPAPEVLSGTRYDIEPVIMGNNAKSDNIVIWAYVFNGVSKKGLPDWKMFRVDRIQNIDNSTTKSSFKLSDIPGYQRGKAPSAMKSLSKVLVYSPYWIEDYKRNKNKPVVPPPPQPREKPVAPPQAQQPPQPEQAPQQEPQTATFDANQHRLDVIAYNNLKTKAQDVNGEKVISTQDYESALKDLYNKKEGEWKNYQRMLTGNVKPGEGTRKRFTDKSKEEIDALLANDNIKVSDPIQNLAEIVKRFKLLI